MTTNATCDIYIEHVSSHEAMPSDAQITAWAQTVLKALDIHIGAAIVFIDQAEMTALNRQYRDKEGPTNVLSFPFEPPCGMVKETLGDVIICTDVVEEEAKAQAKTFQSHLAHMLTHSLLHLLGYDHQDDAQAQAMETLEIKLLHQLGFANPYEEHHT